MDSEISLGANDITGTTAVINFTNFDLETSGAVTLTGNLALSGDASEGISGGGLVDCDTATSTLRWDVTTNKFSCGAVAGGGADGVTPNVFTSNGTWNAPAGIKFA